MIIFILFILITLANGMLDYVIESAKNNFTGFKVYEVFPKNHTQVYYLQHMDDKVMSNVLKSL